MQAALEIDESDTPSDTNYSSTESDDSVSDDSVSDDSGKCPKKKARTEKDPNDDIDDQDHDGEQETETDAEYENQRGMYGSFDLFKYPWHVGRRNLLLIRCYAEGNPSCLYIKGVEYFYGLNREKEGLGLLKRAADAGYERALYTYAMTRKIFWEDEEYFSRFTRESVGRIGMVVRDEDSVWLNNDNERFIAKRNLFMSTVVPLFYSCPCSPCLDQDWVLWYIECGKAGDMCNR
ncbi:unnamed protein product [Brassica oleracea]